MKVAISTAIITLAMVGCNNDTPVQVPGNDHKPIPADLKHLMTSAHIPGQRFTPTSSGAYAFDGVTGSVCRTFYDPDSEHIAYCDDLLRNYPEKPPSPLQDPVQDHPR